MRVTVAICTWNRAKLLDQTLAQMRGLRIPSDVQWKLLVVNNSSTDDTDAVIARHEVSLPIRRLFQPRQGHSNARNHALAEARGDLILWTDDDVLVDPAWLAEYVKAANTYPEAAYFGGSVEPWYSTTPPEWIRSNIGQIANVYAIRMLSDTVRVLAPREYPVGASMAMRMDRLTGLSFDTNRGRLGSSLRGGDDITLLRELHARHGPGIWVGTAKLRHYIPEERLTAKYVWEWLRWDARDACRGNDFPPAAELFGCPRYLLREYGSNLLGSWLLSPFKGPRWFQFFVQSALCRGRLDEYKEWRAARRSRVDPAVRDAGCDSADARPMAPR